MVCSVFKWRGEINARRSGERDGMYGIRGVVEVQSIFRIICRKIDGWYLLVGLVAIILSRMRLTSSTGKKSFR